MAIRRDVIVPINGSKASLDSKIFVFRNDRGIDLHLKLANFSYVVESLNDVITASARVLKPSREEYFDIDTLTVDEDTIIFTITQSMTDEFAEIGTYSVQISLYDSEGNRITIPSIDFYVKELIAQDAVMEDNDYARADYSLADFGRAAPSEYTSIEGNYVRTWWYAGDYITAAKLDNIENGINLNILQEDFTVQGISIGAAVDKKVYHPGTTALDLIKDMLTVRVVPKYTSPTMSLSSSVTSCELGAMISPTIRINFNTGDSGGIKSSSITHDGSTLTTSTSISISNFLMDRDKEFIGTVEYLKGDIKYDNLGDPVPGFIQEGSITSRLTIKAYRPSFAFCDNVSDVPTSSYIRGKSKYGLNPTKGSASRVTTNPDTNLVVFAYPATLGECTKIRYEDLNDDGSKSIFTLAKIDIPDLQGTNPETYNVYYYIPLVAFGSNATFTMTI